MRLNPTGKTNQSIARSAQRFLVLALLALTGCGGGGGGGGGIDSTIANFSNTFDGVDSTNQLVSLFVIQDQASMNQHSGSFDASRSRITVNNNDIPVSGTFSGSSLMLTLTNPPAPLASSYSGTFSDPDTIVLNGSGGTLTLRRSGGTFTASVPGSWTGTDSTGAAWYVQFGRGTALASNQTFLLTGAELRNGITAPVSGYVSVRYVELHIARSSGEVIMKGQFPISSGNVNGDLITLDPGGSLARGGTADPRSVMFLGPNANGNNTLFEVDLLGLKRNQVSRDPGPDAYVRGFYISPDRSMVAYLAGASQTATSDVFLYVLADGSTKQLTSNGAATGSIQVYWAPNSSAVAFLASTGTPASQNAYYQKISDAAPTLISHAKTSTTAVGWSPDSCQIAYSADQDTSNQLELYVASFCGGLSGKLSGTLPSATSQLRTWSWSPTADVIAFVADERVAGIWELFAVDASTGVIKPVSAMLSTGQSVSKIQWSPNGQWIGFQVNGAGASDSVQSAHSDGSSLSTLSGIAGSSATQSLDAELIWSPDSQRLAFTYTRTAGAQQVRDMYVAAANGSGGQLVSDPAATSGDIGQNTIVWSPDSGYLLYELTTSVGLSDFAVTSILGVLSKFHAVGINTCGDLSAGWSPTGDRVAFFSQATAAGPCNLTITAPDGSGGEMVSGTMSSQAHLSDLTWLNDGKRLLYLSNDDVLSLGFPSPATEFYVSYRAGSAGIKISSIPGDTLWVYKFEAL